MPQSEEENTSVTNESKIKQRKIRKGTRSCWECKRRKARCVFSERDESICVGCRRRGTHCVSQKESDYEAETRENATNRRLDRIETMLEALLAGKQNAMANQVSGAREKRRRSKSPSEPTYRTPSPLPTSTPRSLSSTLSATLHSTLPSLSECRRIYSSNKFVPCFFQQMLTRDWRAVPTSKHPPSNTVKSLAALPSPEVHPIVIAQKMLLMAGLIQFVFSESTWMTRAEEMATMAIDVVAKDELCHNAEGLECLMLEATYHANNGNMRRAFESVRRAMAVGQLLGIHRQCQVQVSQLDEIAPPFNSEYTWYRIITYDRYFSLALGLPQGWASISNHKPIDLPSLDPEEQLERQHTEIASWILDRNERDIDDLSATQVIDQALQSAASLLPSDWWAPVSLSKSDSPRGMFLSTTRLVNQLLHFNLVNHTHLPYLHRPEPIYGYSKAACATASRELVQRYLILFDSSYVTHKFHIVEFFTLTGAMVLLSAHLERHWQDQSQELSVLAHTRASDRAMVESTKNHFARHTKCKGALILQHLLQLEDEAFRTRSVGSGTIVKDLTDESPFFELNLPYFGKLRVNALKICFTREPAIENVSSSIQGFDKGECSGAQTLPSLDDKLFEGFDFSAFVSGGDGIDSYEGAALRP